MMEMTCLRERLEDESAVITKGSDNGVSVYLKVDRRIFGGIYPREVIR